MSSQEKNFSYEAKELEALELSFSPERFRTYLLRANGDRKAAIQLYERNTYLSEALYGVIQPTEITLRNAVHRAIGSGAHGTLWFDKIALFDPQTDMVAEAQDKVRRAKGVVTPGAMVSELRLGFWTALMSPRYEKALWVPYLHKCFPHAKVKRPDGRIVTADRGVIFGELEKIRVLRNRIAHHESILKPDMDQQYEAVLTVLGWMCPTTAQWARTTNCFESRYMREVALPVRPRAFPPAPKPPLPGVPREKIYKAGGN